MNKDFTESMSTRSDKQLVDIVTINKDQYQPEAIIAAEKEIEKRGISVDAENVTNNKIDFSESTFKLLWYHKTLIVLLPAIITRIFVFIANSNPSLTLIRGLPFFIVLLCQYLIYKYLKNKGNTLIAKEFKNWVIYSYYIYIGLAVLLFILTFLLTRH